MHVAHVRHGRFARGLVLATALFMALSLPLANLRSTFASESASLANGNTYVAIDPTGQREGYSTVLYDNTNGLPTSEANAITETEEGFIWIGSYSGLIRYDGNNFERIDSTGGIASVTSLFVDSQNRLWVGTNDSGVAVAQQDEFTFFTKADGLPAASVRAIAEGPDGSIYAGTTQGVAVISPDMAMTTLDDPQLDGKFIRSLLLGPDNLIYGATNDGSVFTLKNGRVSTFFDSETLGLPEVISVLPDPYEAGAVYLGTEGSGVTHATLAAGLPNAIVIDTGSLEYIKSIARFDKTLWVCADNGIGLVEDGGTFERLENIPLDNSIDHMMADYEGNLWFTSSRQGVMKIVPNQFSDLFDRYGLEPAVVNSTCILNGLLFIGSDSGLTVLDETGAQVKVPLKAARRGGGEVLEASDLVDFMNGKRIRSIIRDSKGRLWIASYSDYGLVRYDPSDGGSIMCFASPEGMPSDRERVACELSDGRVAVACTGGLAILQDDRVVRVYDASAGLNNSEVLSVCEATDGSLVIGTDGGGIYILGESGTQHLGTEEGLASDVVMRVKYDPKNNVYWIVTSNSLAFMDEYYQISVVSQFPYSNNFDLYENSDGEMWVLSSNGIYVVPASELLANGEITPVFYGRDEGLPVITTGNSYSELTSDGNLFIAGTTGVAKVNIEVPFESVSDVKMAVPFVQADGEMLWPAADGSFTIPAKVKRLTVHPFVYTYSLMNPQVEYELEGFEQNGSAVRRSELTPLDYTNLRGGTYHFTMRLHDSLGRGNKELSVTIVKRRAFYEQWWFYVLCAAAALIVLAICVRLYVRRRTRALERKERENRQLVREITESFAHLIDMKDTYTNGHSTRVADYTVALARELGYDEDQVERYRNIALLHDLGKIGIPPEVLNKPGKLTDEEYETIKSHTTLGYEALRGISIMPDLALGAWAHHERPDGRGYPQGLTTDEIPRVAQIIAVADCFDAMYSNRPYRSRMNFDKVVSIIREVRGTQLTADVVDAFLRLVERGEFRAPDDSGGGSTENIENIRAS